VFTPARRRGIEILDDPNVDPAVRARSIGDVARSNKWLGGLRAATLELHAALAGLPSGATLLDVGTGLADIPERVARERADGGKPLSTIAVDEAPSLLGAARPRVRHVVCANAMALPFRDNSIDVVFCSQLLHHFTGDDAECVLREMNRVARHAVVVSDLRRSWIAMAGFWLVSFPLGFHRVTRHDGVVSVSRGFTLEELAHLVVAATGVTPRVRRRLGFRLTARWTPRAAAWTI
jgi:ubiquinone/menaquinone biosynthesis C-methylase UbiE